MRDALHQLPQADHLVVTASVSEAVTILTGRPEEITVELGLAPHPTAPRAARDLVSRTLLDWGGPAASRTRAWLPASWSRMPWCTPGLT